MVEKLVETGHLLIIFIFTCRGHKLGYIIYICQWREITENNIANNNSYMYVFAREKQDHEEGACVYRTILLKELL